MYTVELFLETFGSFLMLFQISGSALGQTGLIEFSIDSFFCAYSET